jgi:uncharacterized protein with ParB-like and HNH nuclease domain
MGAIVSVPTHTVPVGVNKSLIIDGQQRLTTISILLCALKAELEAEAPRISDFLINRHFSGADEPKLLPTQGDREIYLKLIRGESVSSSDHLMAKAFKYFTKKLRGEGNEEEGSLDVAKILATLEKTLRVVMINLDENDDPYVIFESLNYLGEPLTHADLVRNFILMKFKNSIEEGGEQDRVYKDLWVPMEQRLGEKLTTYLMHYGRKDGVEVRKSTIYSSFKELIDRLPPGEVENEVRKLSKNAEYYERFLFTDRESSATLRPHLRALEALDVSTCYPLLLKLYEALDNRTATEDDIAKCIGLVESYVVRRSIVGLPNNAIDQIFVQIAGALDAGDVFTSILNRLSEAKGRMRWPSDAEFIQAVTTQQQYGKKSTPYVLRRLEQDAGHKEVVDLQKMQIEHVLPQALSEEWKTALGAEAENIKDRLQHTLGNLTLTGYNPELGNQTFEQKKEIYAESHIDLNTWISEQPSWDEETILRRAGLLADKCIAIWGIPAQ